MVYRKEAIVRRIEKLKEYGNDMMPYASMPLEDFTSSKKDRYAAERILFLTAECIIDIFDHILSTKFSMVSESYEETISNAFEKGIIDKTLYEKLRGLGGFRNILAHGYLIIDSKEIYNNLVKMSSVLNDIIAQFERIA